MFATLLRFATPIVAFAIPPEDLPNTLEDIGHANFTIYTPAIPPVSNTEEANNQRIYFPDEEAVNCDFDFPNEHSSLYGGVSMGY